MLVFCSKGKTFCFFQTLCWKCPLNSYEQFLPSSLLDWTYSQEANALQFKSIVEDSEVVYQPDHFALKTPASLQINNIQKSDSGMIKKFLK